MSCPKCGACTAWLGAAVRAAAPAPAPRGSASMPENLGLPRTAAETITEMEMDEEDEEEPLEELVMATGSLNDSLRKQARADTGGVCS